MAMSMRTLVATICLGVAVGLSGCGGGDGTKMSTDGGTPTTPTPTVTDIDLMGSPDLAPGTTTVQPGQTRTVANTTISCPAGGEACVVEVTRDETTGQLSATSTGGVAMVAYAPPPLTPAIGLTISETTPVHAGSASDTVEMLLPDASNRFAPLTTAMAQDYGAPGRARSASISNDAHIKTIQSDGAGGFHVTYVLGTDARKIHFVAADFGTGSYYKEAQDGSRYWLWSYTGAFRRDNRTRGSTEFQYFDAHGGSYDFEPGNGRVHFTYGVRTDSAALPAGTATYGGRMSADLYPMDDPRTSARSRMWGDLRLTVDFSRATLDGEIVRVRVQEPGRGQETLPPSEYFEIAGGRIVHGQFTATLTGVNPDGGGLDGDVLGEFYGPAAEEVGGVFNAASDDDVMIGWFGGDRFDLDPSVPSGSLSQPLSVAVDRDIVGNSASEANARVTSVRSDGAKGFDVTYEVDGQRETVSFDAADAGFFNSTGIVYSRTVGSNSYAFNDAAGSLSGNAEFSHFNVNGWSATDYSNDGFAQSVKRGFLAYGVSTGASDLPSGTATYSGRAAGDEWTGPSFNTNRGSFTGSLSLTANFDTNSVDGSVTGIRYRAPGQTEFGPLEGSFSFDSGTISGSGFTADLAGPQGETGRYEGTASGQFYGPAATEVGGVFQGTHTGENSVLHGWFGGKKQ